MNVIVLIIAHHHLLSDFADLPGWGRRIVNEKSVPLRIYRRAIGCGAGETPELPFLISLKPGSRVVEQRRHLSRGGDARRHRGTLGCGYEHQRQGRLLRQSGRAANDDRAETRRHHQFGIDGRQNREPSQPAIQRQQGGGHQHDQEPRDCACCRWDPRELRVPRLCGDGHVDVGGARTGSAAQPIARRVHPPTRKTDPFGPHERPEDVADVTGFLVSPRSEYVTGQALSVDGGLVMHG